MDKLLAHFILSKLLFLLCIIIAAPVWYPAVLLGKALQAGEKQNVLGWAVGLALLCLFFGLYWLASRMSYHMTIEEKTFRCGVKGGLQDARLHLAFLPLVGHWFVPEKHLRDFDQDDDD